MSELASEITGEEVGRFAEARQRERQAADEEEQRQDEERKNEFLWGGIRLTSLGVNGGAGFGNEGGLGVNGFVNANFAFPLVWRLFADLGADFGFIGNIQRGDYDYRDEKYTAIRPYGRINIGIPLDLAIGLFLPYAGVGFGYLKATYEYNYEDAKGLLGKEGTITHEYTGIDMAFGTFAVWGHHSARLGFNLNNVLSKTYSEFTVTLGYAYQF
jgi:opacity protein-like surface antigen